MNLLIPVAVAALVFAVALPTRVTAQTVRHTPGECHDGPAIEAAMAKDGQRTIFIGKRPIIGGLLGANAFTMNKEGFGYNIERDPETGKLCIRAAFDRIQLNYPDNGSIPEWGRSIKPSGTGIDVERAYLKGGRLVFRAQTYRLDDNGRTIHGKAIVIAIGSIEGQGFGKAAVWSVDRKGMPDSSFNMIEFRIVTEAFSSFMSMGFGSGEPTQSVLPRNEDKLR